jgi:hypothetical protein
MGKNIYLGRYDTAEEAAHVRDKAASRYFGEFAVLNFAEEGDHERQYTGLSAEFHAAHLAL